MKDFETWYLELIGDQIWSMPAMMQHKEETFKQIARKVYMSALADRERGSLIPMTEHRRHVYNIVCKTPGDRPKEKPWYEKALEKKLQEDAQKEEWKPASPESVDRYVAEIQKIIAESPMMNAFPRIGYKQSIEEGGWLPPKQAPYPGTTEQEAYARQRHIEYVKANYEPRTGAKLPDWIEEDEWNKLYDEGLL